LGDYYTKQKATVEFEWHSGGHEIRQNEIGAIEAFLKA
ncbi:alpha/beta hydrolase, partial [Sinorhizobium meliloti]